MIKTIGVINSGVGNIHSVNRALATFDIKIQNVTNPDELFSCDKIIIPGVGAMHSAMNFMVISGLKQALIEFAGENRAVLGICLGMQMLFTKSVEFGYCDTLNLINGDVRKINSKTAVIPHTGWNKISVFGKNDSLFSDISGDDFFYFSHSLHCVVDDDCDVNYIDYSGKKIVATVSKNNIFGTQFHPELSAKSGLKIYEKFINL
jgi:imidazole glycerol-phosphate synthase subunit HisH